VSSEGPNEKGSWKPAGSERPCHRCPYNWSSRSRIEVKPRKWNGVWKPRRRCCRRKAQARVAHRNLNLSNRRMRTRMSGGVGGDRLRGPLCAPVGGQLLCNTVQNQCGCGYATHRTRGCESTPLQVRSYLSRVSGPLLYRIDLHVDVPATSHGELVGEGDDVRSHLNPPHGGGYSLSKFG
jgi:hypothetical protein